MAFYFLGLSPTYLKCTAIPTNRQREAVCARLKENYKATRGRDGAIFAEVKEELAREGVEFSEKDYTDHKILLRSLYAWLRAKNETEKTEAIEGLVRRASEVIEHFRVDGIRSWSDIVTKAPDGAVSLTPVEETDTPPEERRDIRARLRELGAGEELLQLLSQLSPLLEETLAENQTLKDDAILLTEEVARLQTELQTTQEFVGMIEGDNEVLEKRLRDAHERLRRAHSATVQEIAEQHPEIPQLFTAAEQLLRSAGKKEGELEKLAEQLPKTFTWESDHGEIRYHDRFLRLVLKLPREDQERVIKQIELFTAHGPEHKSLHTRKHWAPMRFTPSPSFGSRITDEIRFTWTKNGSVTIHWLYRKGDSRVRQSEA